MADRELSPQERAEYERRLKDLGGKLDKATGVSGQKAAKAAEAEADAARGKAMGMGFSIAAQLVAGVLVGGGAGYYLDRWLGTQPWLMIVLLCFGFAAGLLNVIRIAREMQKISVAQSKGAKAMPEDDDDK